MVGGVPKYTKGTAEVVEADAGLLHVRVVRLDLRTDILGGGSVGLVVRVRDVVHDATHQEIVGRIPQQGGLHAES